MLLDLRSGDATVLLDEAVVEARYAAGHLVYVLGNGSLLAAPFDLRTHKLTAPPVTLATGVTLTGSGQAQFSVASNGTVAYLVEAGRSLVVTDRAGVGRPVLSEMRNYHHPRFSPDGQRISVDFNGPDGRDVWILNLADGAFTRATFDRDGHDANWSKDGKSLAYTSFRRGVFGVHRIRPGSTQSSDSLLTSPRLAYSGIWLRDESALVTVGQSLTSETNLDIAINRNGGRGPIEPIVATKFVEEYPALSPDEQWLAFTSNQSGREEVYVRRLVGEGEQIPGLRRRWNRAGVEPRRAGVDLSKRDQCRSAHRADDHGGDDRDQADAGRHVAESALPRDGNRDGEPAWELRHLAGREAVRARPVESVGARDGDPESRRDGGEASHGGTRNVWAMMLA
jgi:hypothetical protein